MDGTVIIIGAGRVEFECVTRTVVESIASKPVTGNFMRHRIIIGPDNCITGIDGKRSGIKGKTLDVDVKSL